MTRTGIIRCSCTTMMLIALVACSIFVVVPVSAATKYLGGAPVFSAEVSGVNEFTPGEDTTISIVVKNSGVFTLKQLGRGTIEPEDLPTTAKTATIGLSSNNDSVFIKTDPQMVGDIPGDGKTITVQFKMKISSNTTTGEYQLPLSIRYRYPRVIEQEAKDVFEFTYNDAQDILPVTIRIKPQVQIDVVDVVPEQLMVGSEGYLNLKIRNTGLENGEMTSVKLLQNGNSPVIPSDSTIFVGNFSSGGTVECRYKVSVTKDATNQTYPVDVIVTYTNREGTIVTSKPETIGVPVMSKTVFSVISSDTKVLQGSTRTIDIQYRNDGNVTIYNAQARISPHDPFTSTDNNAFLGDLAPGGTASAQYKITAADSAQPMEYTVDSKIRYRDALDTSQESDTIGVAIEILPAKPVSIAGLPLSVVIPGVCLVIIAGIIGLRFYRDRVRLK